MSTSLPLASSPHWAPTTTMLGMATLHETGEVPNGIGEEIARGDEALATPLPARLEVQHAHLVGATARATDHPHPARPPPARIGERVLQPPADDVPRHRRAEVAIAPGDGEGLGLVRGEIDDVEVRT